MCVPLYQPSDVFFTVLGVQGWTGFVPPGPCRLLFSDAGIFLWRISKQVGYTDIIFFSWLPIYRNPESIISDDELCIINSLLQCNWDQISTTSGGSRVWHSQKCPWAHLCTDSSLVRTTQHSGRPIAIKCQIPVHTCFPFYFLSTGLESTSLLCFLSCRWSSFSSCST